MNSLTSFATPQKALSTPAAQSTPSTPQTGTWQHPRMAEITRRQQASTFSEQNLRSVIYNVTALFGCYVLEKVVVSKFPSIVGVVQPLKPYNAYAYTALRAIFLINIVVALWPLFSPKDNLNDIALTPAQRSLLGLPASTAPPTPGSTYATPPRYALSPARGSAHGSAYGSAMSNRSNSNTPMRSSPLSFSPRSGGGGGTPSGNFGTSTFGASTMSEGTPSKGRSEFSPTQASPLLQKSFANQSLFGRMSEGPGTPSPSGKSSVPLNNKWLYEKGRTSQSGGGRLFRD